ncbi:MAG TPA: hypothetical protein VMT30_01025 [Candidatus Saccharimonadia bacterium]|nr:hypothetical protein [Candidatus Saccharimonadia bacterium]
MLSLLYLCTALGLGAAVVRRLGLRSFGFEAPALAVTLGVLLWTWLSLLTSLLLPTRLSLPLTAGIASLVGWWLWRGAATWQWRTLPHPRRTWPLWAAFSAATTGVIGWLMWTHDLLPGDGGIYSGGATWADFGLHASLISHFAALPRLSFDFPVAAGAHLTYPLLTDLLSSWLVAGGWSLHAAIFVPSLLLVMAFVQLVLSFGLRLFGRLSGAVIGLTLMLLCGSAVGLFVAAHDQAASGLPLTQFLAQLPKDYTALTEPNAQLTNFVADALLPQRSLLLGLSTFATVMVLFAELRRRPNRRLAIFAGAVIGLTPLAHSHTFIVLACVSLSFWIEAVIRTHRPRNLWLLVGLTAIALAAPQVAWQILANHGGTGGHLALGWTINPGEPLVAFWSHNYGLTGLLIVGTAAVLIARRSLRPYLAWYAPFIGLFILANVYAFQPFAYDNLKLIYYAFLTTYLLVGYGCVWLAQRYRLTIIPLLALGLFLSAAGALAVAREFQLHDQFASPDDIELANWVRGHTAPTDVFAATDRPNQPISTLAGRPLVAGYRGWLYSYHLEYQPRLDTIQQALSGRLTAANPYHARYVAVAAYESRDWTVAPNLAARYTIVYANPNWTIYQLPDR